MSTVQQAVEKPSDEAVVQTPARKPFNAFPLLGLAITVLCAVAVYGGIYLLTN